MRRTPSWGLVPCQVYAESTYVPSATVPGVAAGSGFGTLASRTGGACSSSESTEHALFATGAATGGAAATGADRASLSRTHTGPAWLGAHTYIAVVPQPVARKVLYATTST